MALMAVSADDMLAKLQTTLEQNALPAFLQRQRWFGGKARSLARVSLRDWHCLQGGRDTSAEQRPGPALYFVLLDVRYADGAAEQYFTPLALRRGTGAATADGSNIVAQVQLPEGMAVLTDALADDEACALFLTAIEQQRTWTTRTGSLCGIPTKEFTRLRGSADDALPVHRSPKEQSNTNIHFGDRLILKLFRRCEGGPNPDFEISRFLTERTTFQRVPRLAGGWLFQPQDDHLITLTMLQGMVINDGNAWDHALAHLAKSFERFARHPASAAADEQTPIFEYLPYAELIGQRTAELHLALASDPADPNFCPEPLTPSDLASVSTRMRNHRADVFTLLQTRVRDFTAGLRAQVEQLVAAESEVFQRLQSPALTEALTKIRCHGDYHLGQVLVTPAADAQGRDAATSRGHDIVILDFEGEPTRPLAERRSKFSPLKDVAGMIRSFHYAVHAALIREPADRRLRLESWADHWQRRAAAAFLHAYCAAATGASFLPKGADQFRALLDLYLLEKALYELHYELNNRPDWVGIPVQGLLAILANEGPRP